jgi:hypothetical protein
MVIPHPLIELQSQQQPIQFKLVEVDLPLELEVLRVVLQELLLFFQLPVQVEQVVPEIL